MPSDARRPNYALSPSGSTTARDERTVSLDSGAASGAAAVPAELEIPPGVTSHERIIIEGKALLGQARV